MKIATITNKTNSGELSVSKSIGNLIIATDVAVGGFRIEKVTIYIERANGNNVYLANKVDLASFILASTYGSSAVQSSKDYKQIALCELAVDGGIFLDEKETLKIEFDGLDVTKKYDLFGVEEPEISNLLYFFENKSVSSEDTNKKIQLTEFDMMVLNNDDTISDISLTFANRQVIKYLPFELEILSKDIDPISVFGEVHGHGLSTVSLGYPRKLCLPLISVDFLEMNKEQGELVNFMVRTIKQV